MRYHWWIGTLLVACTAASQGLGTEPPCCESPRECLIKRLCPINGCNPYGGGLVHWWPRHCFPRYCTPNDYCRKPLPKVCWPGYPPFYTWEAPEICCPFSGCK